MDDVVPQNEEELPLATIPLGLCVSVRGFSDDASARQFGELLGDVVSLISRRIDLERLDGITVAFDYDEALASLDRGFNATRPLTKSHSDKILGVAMTPVVVRDGVVKAHMVFHAPFVLGLSEDGTENSRLALSLVAHECGHVADLKDRDQAFPDTIAGLVLQGMDFFLEDMAAPIWEEYAACRHSAIFAKPWTGFYEDGFTSTLEVARDRANAAIREYRLHGSIDQVLREACPPLSTPLRMAGYLLGHLDGLELGLDRVPRVKALFSDGFYSEFLQEIWTILRALWSNRGTWSSRAEFDPLKRVVHEMLAAAGLHLQPRPEGQFYVHIPYTPETMP